MRVLVFCVDRNWTGIARLPHALADAGFDVACLCDPHSWIARTRYLARRYDLPTSHLGEALFAALAAAIRDWRPVRLVPGDEDAVRFMQRIVTLADSGTMEVDGEVLAVVRASLGDKTTYAATLSKHATQQVAQRLGIVTPESHIVNGTAQALDFAAAHGYPVVLKKAHGSAGSGVRVCPDRNTLERTTVEWLDPQRRFPFSPQARAALRRGDLVPALKRIARDLVEQHRPLAPGTGETTVIVQRYIEGMPAMFACVANEGRVLAGIAGLKLSVHPPVTGPASVVRLKHAEELAAAAGSMIREYGFNGFASFDFILEKNTNIAHLIECNPRPVPILHLGPRAGADLCAAWHAALAGAPAAAPEYATQELTVTLFPQELLRDPVFADLRTDLHDIPHDDPELLDALSDLVRREADQRP